MLDFLTIAEKKGKGDEKDTLLVYPKFKITNKSKDLMIRGGDFYAVWVESKGLWSIDEDDALELIDKEIYGYCKQRAETYEGSVTALAMRDADSGMIDKWHKYCQKQLRDNFHTLDQELIFADTETSRESYATKKLPYALNETETPYYEKLISTLYDPSERRKLEWAIGAIITGDAQEIQKFEVLYGAVGTGKSTILTIIQMLFPGYYCAFDAKALGNPNNSFALEAFRSNPLVAIQHDGDLSRIEDNTRLNSLVSHELMTANEKYKSAYETRFQCFLFMGTNKPVKITDAKSGLIRRLIDVNPSGRKLPVKEYRICMKNVEFELGGIAAHCKNVYLEDPGIYDDYIPVSMMGASNDFYNYVLENYYVFKKEDGTTLKAAWEMYKQYNESAKVQYSYPQRVFREELKNYFKESVEEFHDDGGYITVTYSGFRADRFQVKTPAKKEEEKRASSWLEFNEETSLFDDICKDYPAQYANQNETPNKAWDSVTTTLKDLDTSKLHYVKVPENHIVIDFDIRGKDGEKSFEENLKQAEKWPKTYAELSKSGKGIHLHYIYTGDVSKLSRIYDDQIEVKVFSGKSALRRKLTKCNDIPISTISSGLPLKGDDKVVDWEGIQNEKMLRTMIKKNLRKEYHAATKPSIDYIYDLLEDAYKRGIPYDVSDMRGAIVAFAAQSTNQADYCLKLVGKMKFKSEEESKQVDSKDDILVFFDCEVFPNLFLVNWKVAGDENPVVPMVNPTQKDIEDLLRYRLVGFNNRRYDNHMLYGRLIGYSNIDLFNLSTRIINTPKGEANHYLFGEAYNLSYTDVYDFAAKKQSLKKWEIELGIHHKELGLPWDKPVPKELWPRVVDYCKWDVIATEKVFNHLKGDWIARQILADITGMTVNDTTNSLTTRLIFGNDRNPKLVYTNLATGEQSAGRLNTMKGDDILAEVINAFPGYEFKRLSDGQMHNIYRGTDVGKGGYIISNAGIYENVALLDIQSLHPNSIIAMNYFGEHTKMYKELLDMRILIKHGNLEEAKKKFGGRLAHYLDDPATAKDLAQAIKIALNSCYGLTAAKFNNPMHDPRNVNNIVALRGALFMRTLQDEVESRGFKIVAIKTDSIKIANATREIVQFCFDFAKKYSYTFEHEATYDRICQINDADYIARYKDSEWCEHVYGYVPDKNQKHSGEWTVTGKQFAIPFVFKTLFSKEPIEFKDYCVTQETKTALYLDMNEGYPDSIDLEKKLEKLSYRKLQDGTREKIDWMKEEKPPEVLELEAEIAKCHNYIFVGRVGSFCPIKPGCGGGLLRRQNIDKKTGETTFASAAGSKGFRWMETEMVEELEKEDDIDIEYFRQLTDSMVDEISKYGDFEWFVSDDHDGSWSMEPVTTAFDVR